MAVMRLVSNTKSSTRDMITIKGSEEYIVKSLMALFFMMSQIQNYRK